MKKLTFLINSYANFTFQELIVCNKEKYEIKFNEKINYSKIIRVSQEKYLGLIFNYNMRWHILEQNITTWLRTIIMFKLNSEL